jgi:hypothetical protein
MKRMLVLLAMMPVLALAKSPFDGTWKMKLDSVKYSGKPQEVELVGGKYTCKSCVPPFTIPADGKPQPTPGRVSSDHMAVKVASPTTVEYTRTLQGKVVGTGSDTVSADGKLMTSSFVDYSGEKPVDGKYTMKRVGPGVPGGHAISGSWMAEQAVDQSDAGSTIVLQSTDNGMRWTWTVSSWSKTSTSVRCRPSPRIRSRPTASRSRWSWTTRCVGRRPRWWLRSSLNHRSLPAA